jgi:hypothetical protein
MIRNLEFDLINEIKDYKKLELITSLKMWNLT